MTVQNHLPIPFTTDAVRAPRRAATVARALAATSDSLAPTAARLALGAILFPHGAQHALGWFGGYGFSGTLAWMSGPLGFPAPLAAIAIVTELLAPIALIFGIGGRVAGALLATHMLFAASTHIDNGFFMNWVGAMPGGQEGYEYHLLAAALGVVIALAGSGRLSVDRMLTRAAD